jgi:hypothetical protein
VSEGLLFIFFLDKAMASSIVMAKVAGKAGHREYHSSRVILALVKKPTVIGNGTEGLQRLTDMQEKPRGPRKHFCCQEVIFTNFQHRKCIVV